MDTDTDVAGLIRQASGYRTIAEGIADPVVKDAYLTLAEASEVVAQWHEIAAEARRIISQKRHGPEPTGRGPVRPAAHTVPLKPPAERDVAAT